MGNPDLPSQAERLRWARQQIYQTVAAAAAALDIPKSTLQSHEDGSRSRRGLSNDQIDRYAQIFRVSRAWLAANEGDAKPRVPAGFRKVRVRGAASVGTWMAPLENSSEVTYDVFVPDFEELRRKQLYGIELRDMSINRVYPPGTICVLSTMATVGARELEPGKKYHIERRRSDGFVENTIKVVDIKSPTDIWLLTDSSEYAYQQPIHITDEIAPQISFIGRVVLSIVRE